MTRATMSNRFLVLVLLISSLSLLNACGGNNTPPPPPGPTVNITASSSSIAQGQTVTLTWSTTNATSCSASASPAESDWSGDHATSGTQSVTPASLGTINYGLTCSGAGGSGSGGVAVGVSAVAGQTTHFQVSGPANVDSGVGFSVTVTALDSFNTTVTSYSGTVHFTSTDPYAQLPPDSTLVSGTSVFPATLALPGAETIIGTDAGTASITGSSNAINVGAQAFPVALFGAKGDGKTDDTAAIQSAINAAAAAGGGSIVFKVARYFTTGTLHVPTGVVLSGSVEGPFDVAGVNPGQTAIAPTLLVTNTSGPFISLEGIGAGVTDLLFHYPNQVASSASVPNVYPYTIVIMSPGTKVVRSTVTNAYNFLDIEIGRAIARDLFIGAFNVGVNIDNAYDFVSLQNLHNGVFWDEIGGASYPSAIDTWVLNHGTALVVNQMDALVVHDFYAFSRQIGILLTDSPNLNEPGIRTVWGTGSDIDLENVQYGIVAIATNYPGCEFTNVVVGAAPGLGQAAVQLRSGGTNAPDVIINGGAVQGTWALGAFPAPEAGTLTVVNVI